MLLNIYLVRYLLPEHIEAADDALFCYILWWQSCTV